MIFRVVIFVLVVVVFQGCTFKNVRKMKITDNQILSLSEDCDYVFDLVSKGMKKARGKKGKLQNFPSSYYFFKDDLLAKVLISTFCYNGQSQEDITRQLGTPSGSCITENCGNKYLWYELVIDESEIFSIHLVFVDGKLMSTRSMNSIIVKSH